MRLAIRVLLVFAGLVFALPAAAQTVLRVIDLGDGITVTAERVLPGTCALPYGPCTLWHAVGLDIARMDGLLVARTFARVPHSARILAAVPHRGSFYRTAGMLFTDDRGANWQSAAWPSVNAADAIAFDAEGALGVAVGPSRSVWITTDQGAHWIERTSSAGLAYTEVLVNGDAIVIVDAAREAWRSRDRAFSLASIGSDVTAPLRIEGGFIVVTTATRTYRIASDGRVRAE